MVVYSDSNETTQIPEWQNPNSRGKKTRDSHNKCNFSLQSIHYNTRIPIKRDLTKESHKNKYESSYFTAFVMTSKGSEPAATKTKWVPSNPLTAGSPKTKIQVPTSIHIQYTFQVNKKTRWNMKPWATIHYRFPNRFPIHYLSFPEEQLWRLPLVWVETQHRVETGLHQLHFHHWNGTHHYPPLSKTEFRRGCLCLKNPFSGSSTIAWTGNST